MQYLIIYITLNMVLHQSCLYEVYSHRIRTALYVRIPSRAEAEDDEYRLLFPPHIYNDVTSVTDCAIRSLSISAASFLYNLEEKQCDPAASPSHGVNTGFYHYTKQETENFFKACRYQLSKRKTSFQEAKKRCETEDGYLLKIETKDENDFIKKLFPGKSLWLGATVSNSGITWGDGQDVQFTDFVANDPVLNDFNLLKVSRCIILTHDGWKTESCAIFFNNHFVCEFDQCIQ
ncbi:uncharacterized protein LOC134229683 [Saccostrea cucullata]|uniref:uncharacterized protein LOC134229683 n=1 Tax=Saccostrea cuccullata TaxID=36930 RepID=UPI002ED387E3